MSGSVPSSLSPTDQMHESHMIFHSLTGEREEGGREEVREEGRGSHTISQLDLLKIYKV